MSKKGKWHFKTYKCFLCGQPGFKVHNRYPQDFIARLVQAGGTSQGFCVCCNAKFALFVNPNPPGRKFIKKVSHA